MTMTNVTDAIGFFDGIQSPIACWKLNIAATFIVFMLFCSVSANSTLLWVFYGNKELVTPLNVFVIAMTTINLFGSISEFTFIIASNYACRWVFGRLGCLSSGFVMYTVGMMQIYLMAAISFERFLFFWILFTLKNVISKQFYFSRFYIIYKPMAIKDINFKSTLITVGLCFSLAFFWSFMPLIGWSYYTLEGSLTQCSVEWADRSWNVFSYNLTLFIFGFVCPMGLIIYCNIQLMNIVGFTLSWNYFKVRFKKIFYFIKIKAMPNMAKDDEKAKKRIENERQLTIVMMIYIGNFQYYKAFSLLNINWSNLNK